jgi:hypothetical protein
MVTALSWWFLACMPYEQMSVDLPVTSSCTVICGQWLIIQVHGAHVYVGVLMVMPACKCCCALLCVSAHPLWLWVGVRVHRLAHMSLRRAVDVCWEHLMGFLNHLQTACTSICTNSLYLYLYL